jgi:hypothetical protein
MVGPHLPVRMIFPVCPTMKQVFWQWLCPEQELVNTHAGRPKSALPGAQRLFRWVLYRALRNRVGVWC